eukprot:TRINITY_DN12130_c0_g3_i1.p1 TRINITY_DN12130_c0_g3~~TRINITY_DN12130_c0_g3_i1.p1  ORF type:complete len:462 (-),score=31.63 TRINITY_DN12130_c0_g3_i1:55-1440(-)
MYKTLRDNWGYLDIVSISAASVNMGYKVRNIKKMNYNIQRIINVYGMILELILDKLDELECTQLTTCLWSLGNIAQLKFIRCKLQDYDKVFQKLCNKIGKLDSLETTQKTSMILWAMAKYKYKNKEHINKIVSQLFLFGESDYNPVGISSIFWSLSILEIDDLKTIKKMLQLVKLKIESMRPVSFCNIFHSLKTLRYYDQEIIDISFQIIKSRTQTFSRIGVNVILQSLLELNIFEQKNRSYYQQNQEVLDILFDEFRREQWVQISIFTDFIYYCAALGFPTQKLQPAVEAVEKLVDGESDKEYEQHNYNPFATMRRAQILYESKGENNGLIYSEKLQQLAIQNMQSTVKKRFLHPYPLVQEVAQFLRQHFEDVQEVQVVYDEQITIQIQIQKKGTKVCLMGLEGSNQYMLSHPQNIKGSIIVWINVIENLGWKVIFLTEEQWNSMDSKQDLVKQIEQCFN